VKKREREGRSGGYTDIHHDRAIPQSDSPHGWNMDGTWLDDAEMLIVPHPCTDFRRLYCKGTMIRTRAE
jgi:hypothetical protein